LSLARSAIRQPPRRSPLDRRVRDAARHVFRPNTSDNYGEFSVWYPLQALVADYVIPAASQREVDATPRSQ
jgi:hypothetical protein